MRRHDQRAARRLVAAARLHADEAVLHQVDAADGVLAADLVERFEQISTPRHAPGRSTETGTPFSKPMVTSRRLVGRFRRALGEHPDRRPERRWPGLPVRRLRARCARCCGRGCRSSWSMRIGTLCWRRVFDGVLARDDVPLAPRRDHRQVRRQRLVGQLEAHLVVALAGAAVRQARRSRSSARLPPASWRAAAARSKCRAGTCARRRRPSAPCATGTR